MLSGHILFDVLDRISWPKPAQFGSSSFKSTMCNTFIKNFMHFYWVIKHKLRLNMGIILDPVFSLTSFVSDKLVHYCSEGIFKHTDIFSAKNIDVFAIFQDIDWLCWGLTSTLVGHFVSSPREREKRNRRDSSGDEREGQGRNRNRNESEETGEINKNIPPLPLPATKIAGFAQQ